MFGSTGFTCIDRQRIIKLHSIILSGLRSPMLHSDLLRDPYPTRPYLHAVGDDLTDVIRVFRSVVAYDHFNSFDRSYRRRLTLIPAANIRIEMRKYRVPTQSFANCPPAFCSFRLYQLLSDRLEETKKSVQKEKKKKMLNASGENVNDHVIGVRRGGLVSEARIQSA